MKSKVTSSCNSKQDSFKVYVPERDEHNRVRYVPLHSKKAPSASLQRRRVVKFKETTEYSEEKFGSLRRERKASPRKIVCVTEIMVDISDSDSRDDDADRPFTVGARGSA